MNQLQMQKGRPKNGTGRTDTELRVYDFLDQLGIEYERIDHEAVETMEDCIEIDQALAPAVVCKNLFLTNSKEDHYYLLMMLGSTRLSFASAERMKEYLDIRPGSVSVMGLINDTGRRVKLLVDEDLLAHELLGCHPCVNTSSLRLKTGDVLEQFVPATGHDYVVVHIGKAANL